VRAANAFAREIEKQDFAETKLTAE